MKFNSVLLLTTLLVITLFLSIPYIQCAYALDSGSVVTSVPEKDAVRYQNKVFYANGIYWVFYTVGVIGQGEAYYSTSIDGLTWSDSTFLTYTSYYLGESFAVHFDGNAFSVVAKTPTGMLYYRKGIPQNDGTITWLSENWQPIWDALAGSSSGGGFTDHYLSVDSDGYPVIAWYIFTDRSRTVISFSDSNMGIWHTAEGYPLAIESGYTIDAISALSNRQLYVIMTRYGQQVAGRYYDGSTWHPTEIISTSQIATEYSFGSETWSFSLTESQDNTHLVFLSTDNRIIYLNRDGATGTWSNETTLQDGVTPSASPQISVDKATENLVVFWQNNDHIYYKQRINGIWDSEPTDWINEENDHLPEISNSGASTLNAYRYSMNNEFGIAYTTGLATPYTLKFALLNVPQKILITPETNHDWLILGGIAGLAVLFIVSTRKNGKEG